MITLKFIDKVLIEEVNGMVVRRQPFKPASDDAPQKLWDSKEEAVEWYNSLLPNDIDVNPDDVVEE